MLVKILSVVFSLFLSIVAVAGNGYTTTDDDHTFPSGRISERILTLEIVYKVAGMSRWQILYDFTTKWMETVSVDPDHLPTISNVYDEEDVKHITVAVPTNGSWKFSVPSRVRNNIIWYYIHDNKGNIAIHWIRPTDDLVVVGLPKYKGRSQTEN